VKIEKFIEETSFLTSPMEQNLFEI